MYDSTDLRAGPARVRPGDETSLRGALEESHRVSKPHAAANLRSELFDEREIVAIQPVAEVEPGN